MNYRTRNRSLKKLGFKNYGIYLGSQLWKDIRKKVFKKKGTSCSICKKPGFYVHHRSYSINALKGKDISNLVPICKACHTIIEFDVDSKKRSIKNTDLEYSRLANVPSLYADDPIGVKQFKGNISKNAMRGSLFSKCSRGPAPELTLDQVIVFYTAVNKPTFHLWRHLAMRLFDTLPWYFKVREFRYFKKKLELRMEHIKNDEVCDSVNLEFRSLVSSF